MKRWLAACKGFRAEDLREAARRFDRILLRGCFTCDRKRNPRYLLAVARTVRDENRPLRLARLKERYWREEQQRRKQAALEQEQQRREHPERAIEQAIELAHVAFDNKGYGLKTATRWLDQALHTLAAKGEEAYRFAVQPAVRGVDDQRVLAWVLERIDVARPPPSSLRQDLLI